MRSEQEMLELVLSVARADERVRAVWMNGSRANPNAPRDCFQDYDIVYAVTDMRPFVEQQAWLDVFGERLIMQTPEASSLFPAELGGRFTYLMQFADGNRIDLMLCPAEEIAVWYAESRLTVPLLDKDGIFPDMPPRDDSEYYVKRPTQQNFLDCCNEFWWTVPYVAKGLWRREYLYAQYHLDNCVRGMLLKMLEWRAGADNGFTVSVGKCGKYLERYIPAEDWAALLHTSRCGSYDAVWEALDTACALMRKTAVYVADKLGYTCNAQEDARVSAYVQCVRTLPADAQEIPYIQAN